MTRLLVTVGLAAGLVAGAASVRDVASEGEGFSGERLNRIAPVTKD